VQALIEYDRVAAPRARHDSLLDRTTGLPRWELLIDRIEVALNHARRTGSVVTLFLVYADGADIPDIVTFADHLRLWLHDGDTLARIGLSDFGILCTDIRTKTEAARHIERGAGVGFQLGCAVSRPDHTADELIRDAIADA
jgi:GGDEF domain-containing protein